MMVTHDSFAASFAQPHPVSCKNGAHLQRAAQRGRDTARAVLQRAFMEVVAFLGGDVRTMLAKLALRNVRRSVRDYAVYFVTLLFGVAVFYAFNSVAQPVHPVRPGLLVGKRVRAHGELPGHVLRGHSLRAGFLGGLREPLPHPSAQAGVRHLPASGHAAGAASRPSCSWRRSASARSRWPWAWHWASGFPKALSFFTAGLFNIPMQQYRFIFSSDAFAQTLLCFVLIFVVVALFNTLSIRRYKLIDLLGAAQPQRALPRAQPLDQPCGASWWPSRCWPGPTLTLIHNGLVYFDGEFWKATALMLVGTFLFFWSVAGFVIAVVERTRGVYFQGSRHVHDAPDSQQGEHGVPVAVGGVRHAVLLAHGVLHGGGAGAAVHR